jgi:monooxygenase
MDSTHEHYDVLIIGAGISGVSAAVHVHDALPEKRYAILEKRDAMGGTWDLFRYPGVRSDSDMYTLGFQFKPWESEKAIAPGGSIRDYVRAAAAEHGVDAHVRYGHRVIAADWDSQTARWTLTAEVAPSGKDPHRVSLSADFVHFTSGYYSYENPYAPQFPGQDRFTGQIVHPQLWPEDLDYAGKRVVVIGSGATAITLVPSMAEATEHITMLQRSPSYVMPLHSEDEMANRLRRVLPAQTAYRITRATHVALTYGFYQYFRRAPKRGRAFINKLQTRMLPDGYPVDVHFNPTYEPWDQRLCFVPDGDLFRALRKESAEIVTGTIATFTETGITLTSGQQLEADIIITATGLNLELLGGAQLSLDGHNVELADRVFYKSAMLSGLPNLAVTFGYTNASWTLKADLVSAWVARLLSFMEDRGYAEAMPLVPPEDVGRRPFIELQSGYVTRMLDRLPQQGSRDPWTVKQSWLADTRLLRRAPIADEGLRFFRRNAGTLGDHVLADSPESAGAGAGSGAGAPSALA